MKNKKCIICGGNIVEEVESSISKYVCEDCDCLQNDDGTIASDIYFYLANYGTDKNIEIFLYFNEAKSESIDSKVHQALINHQNIYYEDGLGWNYEDDNGLLLSSPVEL